MKGASPTLAADRSRARTGPSRRKATLLLVVTLLAVFAASTACRMKAGGRVTVPPAPAPRRTPPAADSGASVLPESSFGSGSVCDDLRQAYPGEGNGAIPGDEEGAAACAAAPGGGKARTSATDSEVSKTSRAERRRARARARTARLSARERDKDARRRETEPDGEGDRREPPGEWFYRQRMGTDGTIPLRARADAYAEVSLMMAGREAPSVTADDAGDDAGDGARDGGGETGSTSSARTPRAAPSDAQALGWVAAGPTSVGGRATALAADPNNPAHAWLGTADGGVFKSTDGGVTWTPVFDAQPTLAIGSIAADPTNSNIVYVGTGEDNGGGYSYDGDGIYRTTDGGATWTNMGLAETRRIARIAIDPSNPNRVFVAAGGGVFNRDANRGVYRSTDGGVNWQKVLYVADDSGAVDVAIDPSQPKRIYAAIWTRYATPYQLIPTGVNSGIWQSTNGGNTWTRLTNGLPAASPSVGRIGLAIAPSSPLTVYALYRDDTGGLMGVWKTTNAGASWFRSDNGNASFVNQGYYFGQIRVDPVDPNTVYALDLSLWKSTDGGNRFQVAHSNPHADQHDLLLLPGGRSYLANDGGVFWSTSGPGSWTKPAALPISQLYDIAVAKTNPSLRLAGLQDNGTQRTTTGSASAWSQVLGNDGTQCEIDPVDASRAYASYQGGALFRSTNGGGSYSGAMSGIDTTEVRAWNTPIAHDPVHTQRLFTGAARVYRSVNGASSWTAISPVLAGGSYAPDDHHDDPDPPGVPPGRVTAGNHGANGNQRGRNYHTAASSKGAVTTIANCSLDTRIIWAGTDDGAVWVTANDGASWARVGPQIGQQWVTRVACDPFEAQTAYVSLSGFQSGVRLPHVFKTANLGGSWTDISANLPQAPINAIVADPQAPGRLYAGGDVGVFMSMNGGAAWFPLAPGLPHVVVMELVLHDATRTLFAATHGRSAYTYDLNQLTTTDTDGDGVPNAADCAPMDGGSYAMPAEVRLRPGPNDGRVYWDPLAVQAGPGTGYDVVRGLVSELSLPDRPSEACIASGVVAGSVADASLPAPGGVFYYLARARNACGMGTWGTNSAGVPHLVTPCP